jgi:heterodisulfide reductase subunit A
MIGSVLVIGAGVSGMQASLDLVQQGFKVYLVEKKPTIGGRMAQLDKMYPTNECAMCVSLPKMLEITSNPNIKLLTYSEVVGVDGSAGNFTVRVLKKPRYIEAQKCNACMECVRVCPVKGIPSQFDAGMGVRKAVYFYSPFPPRIAVIGDECDYLKYGKCGDGKVPPCVEACEPEAIDLNQKPQEVELEVGAIIVATGSDVLEPAVRTEYGYGVYKNVLTALQYERLLSGIGPTAGKVKRADGVEPKRIAWIQCVGSKDCRLGEAYCSAVCCMHAISEALSTKDKRSDAETYIFHKDFLAHGKGFEEYYNRAQKEGVTFVRSQPTVVHENENCNLVLTYETEKGSEELDVDMLVLSSAIIPSEENGELAKTLGVELDSKGFFGERDPIIAPLETTRAGIYICGCAQSPKDISESVAQASAAAAKAAALLYEQRGKEIEKAAPKPMKEVKPTDEPRIGVLLCQCGPHIASYINADEVIEYSKTLHGVVCAEQDKFGCSGGKLKQLIKDYDLNRVVVGACSPKTHEHLFQLHCENAGLNKYLMEMANIRNQCTWVHSTDKAAASEKSKDLIKMAVARAKLLEPLEEFTVGVTQSCLVIGGGISGMKCALAVAEMGLNVHLVEKEQELGGMLRKLNRLYPTDVSASDVLKPIVDAVQRNSRITVHTGAKVKDIQGYIGNYKAVVEGSETEKVLNVGSVVVATGAHERDPTGFYSYGTNGNIITQLELERSLKEGKLNLEDNAKVVMIGCVGSRENVDEDEDSITYCCKTGCGTMVKNAKYITELYPKSDVYVLYQDMRLPGKTEEDYFEDVKQNHSVQFIRYLKDRKPNVSSDMVVDVCDASLNEQFKIKADLIVLTVPTIGSQENAVLKDKLRVPLGVGNFFTETIGKLRPLDSAVDGIFLCGAAHSPKGVAEAIVEADGAASRAANIISNTVLMKEPAIAHVVYEKCDGCAFCIEPCPYDALSLIEYMKQGEVKKIAELNEAICKGCGVCVATCPPGGIFIYHFKPVHFSAMVDAALESMKERAGTEPLVIGFLCNWCAYAGADLAGASRIQYPPNIRIIRVMCTGMVHPNMVMDALTKGADGVLICGCHPGDCHYVEGNLKAESRAEAIKVMLDDLGIEQGRFRLEWISASEGAKFAQVVKEMTETLRALGPSPFR